VDKERDPRRSRLWALQDFSQGRGLEVGPLHEAIVGRDEADVRYVDVHDQAGLRAYYADDPLVPTEAIPEIDYTLLKADGRGVSLAEACREGAPFDWVVASHVVEHVPDVVGWLEDLAELVTDDGALVLMVPDRRYCFDVHRPPTTTGQMLEAHELRAGRPSTRAIYDYFSAAVETDVRQLWDGVPPEYPQRMYSIEQALGKVEQGRSGTYVDCHVWLFTPESFVEQMHELRIIRRSSWAVESMHPTRRHDIEFMVRLRRIPRHLDPTSDQPGELVPSNTRPDWLDEQTSGRQRVAALEAELAESRSEHRSLTRRLQRRQALLRQLKKQVRRQEAQLSRQRQQRGRVAAASKAKQTSRRGRIRSAVARLVPSRDNGRNPNGR